MTWTKNDRFICDHCQKFSRKYDDYTPYGCSNPEAPEPYDPTEICRPCSNKLYKVWLIDIERNKKYGDWIKSKAESRAAKKLGVRWNNSEFKYEPVQ